MSVNSTLTSYMVVLNQIPLLSREEFKELCIAYKDGNESIKQVLIRHNLRLVVKIAKRYTQEENLLLDLIQEGNMGLIKAIDGYDPQLSHAFSTYAVYWIVDAIQNHLSRTKNIVTVPIHIAKLSRKLAKMQTQAADAGTKVKPEEAARKLKVKVGAVVHAMNLNQPDTSMDIPANLGEDGQGSTFGASIPDENDFVDGIEKESARKWLMMELDKLPMKQRKAIALAYGFEGNGTGYTEVGAVLGVSRQRAHQLMVDGYNRIAQSAAAQNLSLADIF